jgi:hypothetical protein
MMVLSRIWYIVLSLVLGVAIYVVYLAVGQYNRRNAVAMTEELASDSQTVGWALQIDARKRLDALLIGAVDKGVQDALQAANAKDQILPKVKDDGRHALLAVLDKIPADWKPDALFAVDHDGRVVSQVGYDAANAFPDFELGGYPVVFDALHGFMRDDTWVLGGRLYRIAARPVEFDSTQPPLGAIVAMRLIDKRFAQDLSKRTRASVAFFANGQRIVSAAVDGFDETQLDPLDNDLSKLAGDKEYAEGRSEVRFMNGDVGVMYARMFGDAWELGAGFAVARTRVKIDGPLGFLNGADDKDKQSVNFLLIGAAVLIGIVGGLGLSLLEHSMPMREMERQAVGLRRGEFDYFQLPRFRGAYRTIAQNVNAGVERVLEKGGGAVRKPADLESILGPVPAQPAMSAFSFAVPDAPPAPSRPLPPSGSGGGPGAPPGSVPGSAPAIVPGRPPPPAQKFGGPGPVPAMPPQSSPNPPVSSAASSPALPGSSQTVGSSPAIVPPSRPGGGIPSSPGDVALDGAPKPPPGPGAPPSAKGAPPPPRVPASTMLGIGQDASGGAAAAPAQPQAARPPILAQPLGGGAATPPSTNEAPVAVPPPAPSRPQVSPASGVPAVAASAASSGAVARLARDMNDDGDDEATVVAQAPSELLARSASDPKSHPDAAEWMAVYDDFVRTKKQCGEPTDGLTFEKFQTTLRKNRDALMQRHNCKRVRFSVYVKEGRASLKATPVRD